MRDITFALIREGTSDDGLVPHIASLLVAAGATSVIGLSRDYKGTTLERLRQVIGEPAAVDMIFVNKDSDARDPSPRRAEIVAAAAGTFWVGVVVPVIPVQELEAWLLVDEAAIRGVVGKPSGKTPLGLPALAAIENRARPKEVLQMACVDASETTGARRRKERNQFPQRRATLLDRLDINGPVTMLSSWRRFVEDLNAAVATVFAERDACP